MALGTSSLRIVLVAVLLLLMVLLTTAHVDALSYSAIPPDLITNSTDVWVHGRIISATGPQTRKNQYGDTFRDITLRLQVVEATDPAVTGVLTIRSETSFHHGMLPGAEVFAAFVRQGDSFAPYSQLGLYGWVPVGDGAVAPAFGSIPAATYWRWLCSLRRVADAGGTANSDDVAYWKQTLDTDVPEVADLAVRYFLALDPSHLDPEVVFDALMTCYGATHSTAAVPSESDFQYKTRLAMLLASVSNALGRYDADTYADRVLDFIEFDATRRKVLRDSSAESVMKLLRPVSNPATLERIPRVLESSVRLNYSVFVNLPIAPSEPLDKWLWDIVNDPQAHKVFGESDVAGVWTALANRGNEDLLPYLRSITENARPGDESNRVVIAREVLTSLERSLMPREERLIEWVERVRRHDTTILTEMAREIRADDTFLVPHLVQLSVDRWNDTNHWPSWVPGATIMKTIAAPEFLPTLREWIGRSPAPELLEALAACGDPATATQTALVLLESQRTDLRVRAWSSIDQTSQILLFLGSFEDPALANQIRPFTDPDTIRGLERDFLAGAEGRGTGRPYLIWSLRDAALLALAKSGDPEAPEVLREAYRTGDIRVRFITALALYAMNDVSGMELIEAYRNRTERTIPELEARYGLDFAGGNFYRLPIVYFANAELDRLYLDRIERGFTDDDRDLAQNPEFVARNELEVLRILGTHLKSDTPRTQQLAIECLERNTGEDFGYDPALPLNVQKAAIARWTEYIENHLSADV